MDHNHLTIKTYMAITAERDAAIRERNMALEERKRAFAERDMAMLQRDAAIAECNSAIQERDEAISVLGLRESSMNDNNATSDSLGHGITRGAKFVHDQQQMHRTCHLAEAAYNPRDIPTSHAFDITGVASEAVKHKKVKQTKETKAISMNSAKLTRVSKKGADDLSKQVNTVASSVLKKERVVESDEDLDRTPVWKDALGLNQVIFDETSMPVPVCSCTGVPQPCYKWGNGGWQSACCTTSVSMYPLPQISNKRYSRVGGRKMSGSAFTKLLNRLNAEGQDLSAPLDLKDHWAKHGTNRYSTLK